MLGPARRPPNQTIVTHFASVAIFGSNRLAPSVLLAMKKVRLMKKVSQEEFQLGLVLQQSLKTQAEANRRLAAQANEEQRLLELGLRVSMAGLGASEEDIDLESRASNPSERKAWAEQNERLAKLAKVEHVQNQLSSAPPDGGGCATSC